MRTKKINYNDIMKRLNDITEKVDNGYMVIFVTKQVGQEKEEKGLYKIEQSNGKKIKTFYLNSEKELDEYLKDKEYNPKCHIIICDIIKER